MKANDQKNLNNLYHRYQSYDNDRVKYTYDIHYTTLEGGTQMKASRRTGIENFRNDIDSLMANFDNVCTITVTDRAGKSPRSAPINPPMVIELMDVKSLDQTPKVVIQGQNQSEQPAGRQAEIMQGLSGLFAGTEYEALGSIAPIAKFIDDKHAISRLREKNDEQAREIDDLKRKNEALTQKYDALNDKYEQLQDDNDDLEDELTQFRNRDRKQDKWVSMLGAAGASMAKNFLRQNPNILSGLIPAEQLAGMFSDDAAAEPEEPTNELSDEEQARLEDATTIFEWLQTLDADAFTQVVSVIAVLRQNTGYAAHIMSMLKNNSNNS